MIARITPTLLICAAGAAITGALLALPVSSDDDPPAPAVSAPAGAPSVEIAGFAFGPARASAGAAVAVHNADGAAHTLTATDGSFDTGVLDGGAAGSFTAPAAPGTYEFTCQLHPSMTGSLVVD